MKLLNQSLKYLSFWILAIVSLWAVIFYFNVLDEIKESLDEGLESYKRQILYRVQTDSTILEKNSFDEGFFSIREITPAEKAHFEKDRYTDTIMYMQDADDEEPEPEPVRMLTTVFEHNGRFYELSIINSMVEEDDLVSELLRDTFWLYLILVAGIILVNNLVLKKLWEPFYHLLGQIKGYRLAGGGNLPGVKTKTREFRDLQNAVNILLERSIKTYEQQKQFIGNASHELQTPLAAAMNKLELLLEKGNLENVQAESIAEVMHLIERMVRLNKSLLLLTKIENNQFPDDQVVSVNKVVRQSMEDLEEIADFRKIELIRTETAEVTVRINPSLANIVVSNLIRNAVFHNTPGGRLTVSISEHKLTVSNTGKNGPLDTGEIFTRFYKSGDSQSGTGLGLAIVKAICDVYGFSVSYRFENNLHCFELDFGGRR